MILKRLLLCAVSLLIPLHVHLYEHFGVTYSHSVCEILNHEIVFNISCSSRVINRTRRSSLDLNFQPGIILDNLYIGIQFYYKFRTVYRPHIIKVEQELCQFLKDETTSKIFLAMAEAWRKAGNALDACPIKGRRYLKDVQREIDNFPIQILPAGDWRIDSTVSTKINNNKIKIFSNNEYYELKTKTTLQWKK